MDHVRSRVPLTDVAVLLFLLVGTHTFTTSVYAVFSIGAGIPLVVGIGGGVLVARQLDDDTPLKSQLLIACVVFGIGLAGSWQVADAIVGSSNDSARIPGFAFGVMAGNIAEQIVSEPVTAPTKTDR